MLGGYVWTLAPTVTFWDAGELIAAAKVLGIPHPPGTPLFVLMAHVWGDLVRAGNYAWRTNLLSAVCSAGGAAWFFLLMARTLRGDAALRYGGAAAAALLSAFAFTGWQNSNETEVYTLATFSIAALCWLAWRWRAARGTAQAPQILLLCVYLLAVSIGNHLLTLLAGPALLGFIWHVMHTSPRSDPGEARAELAQLAVMAGIWALLLGSGLGSAPLLGLGGAAFLAAGVYAATAGSTGFALAALGVGAAGVSTYAFLFIRAGLNPLINEADPSTWDALMAVIGRKQYPVRWPTDNPMQFHGPENTGRTAHMLWWQIVNYLQYYDWQWSNGLDQARTVFAPARFPFTVLFTTLGIVGLKTLRRQDRSVFWLLLLLFLATGPGLVLYMNFRPGASLLWNLYPDPSLHEVRERDYFFTVSYQVWGLFAGIGLVGIYQVLREKAGGIAKAAPAILLLALLPFVLNFRAASRAHGPDSVLARDFAYDLLQSVDPYGILFTNGDNDTFPLWYLQEVEGIRQDVQVVNLSLANTEWFIKQLRDNPVRPFVPAQAPWLAPRAPAVPPPPVHSLTDQEIAGMQAQLLPRDFTFRLGRIERTFPAESPFYIKDVMILRLLQENFGRRPVYYSTTVGTENWLGFDQYLTQEALVVRLHVDRAPDPARLTPSVFGVPLDVPRTDSLAWSVYRYADLLEPDSLRLESTTANMTANLAIPFLALGQAYTTRGDLDRSLKNLRRAYHFSPSAQLAEMIRTQAADSAARPRR